MKQSFLSFAGKRRNWSIPYILFLGFFVITPLLLIVYYAFTDHSGGFTLGNFSKFWQQPEAMHTFVFSIGVALITTIVCLILGYPAAYILSRMESKTAKIITEHPDDSYELIMEDGLISALVIEKPEEFWKISKYAVIETR